MNSSKTLILIRHAHRDNSVHSLDNGLSEHGHEQVKKMLKFAQHRLKETSPTIFASPKKRCQETVGPLAKELGLKVMVDPRLVERQPTEELEHFSDRLDEFLDFWKGECGPVTVICSHADCIPVMI
jgi:broad specificity phosphatase PhoE